MPAESQTTSISRIQLRVETLADMSSFMTPHIMRNLGIRPSEPDYPTIAHPLRLVSDYAKLRQWQILRKAGFKSRQDVYEQALEHIGQDWALASMDPLRAEKKILEERSTHVVSILRGVSEIYRLYPLKRGEKPSTIPSPAAAYEMARLSRENPANVSHLF